MVVQVPAEFASELGTAALEARWGERRKTAVVLRFFAKLSEHYPSLLNDFRDHLTTEVERERCASTVFDDEDDFEDEDDEDLDDDDDEDLDDDFDDDFDFNDDDDFDEDDSDTDD